MAMTDGAAGDGDHYGRGREASGVQDGAKQAHHVGNVIAEPSVHRHLNELLPEVIELGRLGREKLVELVDQDGRRPEQVPKHYRPKPQRVDGRSPQPRRMARLREERERDEEHAVDREASVELAAPPTLVINRTSAQTN